MIVPDADWDKKSVAAGMALMLFILFLISGLFPAEETKGTTTKKLLSPNEACKLFYNCKYGKGTLLNLDCNCGGEWRNFGAKNLTEMIESV